MSGLFSRRQKSVVDPHVLSVLADYGHEVMLARRQVRAPNPALYGWGFVSPVFGLLQGPQQNQVLQEVYDAAIASPREEALVGGYSLLAEYAAGKIRDERYLALLDATLEQMRTQGLNSGFMTGYERDRWIETHGELPVSFDEGVDTGPGGLVGW